MVYVVLSGFSWPPFFFFSFNVSKHRRIAAAGTEVDTGNIQLKLIEVGALMRDFED
jgi:hypothetical protein